jgi:ferric-dicitrate binding protein FerR (iron transport regulator)
MQEDQFWLLVSLKLSGEATEEELATLEAYLQKHPEKGLQLETLHTLWKGQSSEAYRKEGTLDRHLQRLSVHLAEPARPPVYRRLRPATTRTAWAIGCAAACLIAFLFFYLLAPKKVEQQVAQNTVMTKPGSKSKVLLPDGSQVWLNADSRITYDESFRGPYREVKLCGEAYFDIAKDSHHPFIIHTSSIDIKVLGTSLNVRSYRNEQNTEALLIRGSIEVSLRSNPDKKIILHPNEKIVVKNSLALVSTGAPLTASKDSGEPAMILGKAHFQQKDSAVSEVLWVKNKLAFDEESLTDVALKIERWYDVKVIIRDEELKNTHYTAVFEYENLEQVMEALRLTGNFKYSINKNEVTITR